jgi:hypothetical protein
MGANKYRKSTTFTEHLASVFQPHPPQNNPEEELLNLELESPYQLEPPPRRFRRSEVQAIINNSKAKRSPGYLITRKIPQDLPPTAVKYLTQLFNAAILIGYFPMQWKVATIILLQKSGKPPPPPTYPHPTGR